MGRLLRLRKPHHIFTLMEWDRLAWYSCKKKDIANVCLLILEGTE